MKPWRIVIDCDAGRRVVLMPYDESLRPIRFQSCLDSMTWQDFDLEENRNEILSLLAGALAGAADNLIALTAKEK